MTDNAAMCNFYQTPSQNAVESCWRIDASTVSSWPKDVHPCSTGLFLRGVAGQTILVAGQWGLIPSFVKTTKLTYQANNARSEELSEKASYRQPWAKGQRCLIPAEFFDEPCWETGRNVWRRFRRGHGNHRRQSAG